MTTREKIRALRAKAESTTFPGEAEVFSAKADELEDRLRAGEFTDETEDAPGIRFTEPRPGATQYYGSEVRVGVRAVPYGSTGVYTDTFYGGGGGL